MVGAYEGIQYLYMSHVHVQNFEIKFAENMKKKKKNRSFSWL